MLLFRLHWDPVDHLPHGLCARVVGGGAELLAVVLVLPPADEGLDPGARALPAQVVLSRGVGAAAAVASSAEAAPVEDGCGCGFAQRRGRRRVVAGKGTHRRF